MFDSGLVIKFFVSFLVCYHLAEEESAGYFAYTVVPFMSLSCYHFVLVYFLLVS